MTNQQSRGCWYSLSRGLAALLAVLAILTAPLALFTFSMGQVIFNPQTYKRALSAMDFYDRLPALAASEIADSIARNPQENLALADLKKSDIQAILTGLITKDWAREQAESVIDQLFAWLDSDSGQPKILLSMTDLKARMAGPEGASALLKLVSSWPPCTEQELRSGAVAAATGNLSKLPLCKPPEAYMSQIQPLIDQAAAQSAASVPDSIDLANPNGVAQPLAPEDDPRPRLRQVRTLAFFSPIIPALLFLGIAIFAVRSWKDLSRWWGLPLLAAGIVGGVMSLFMLPVQDVVMSAIGNGAPQLPSTFEDVLRGLLGAVFQTVGWWVGLGSVIIGGGGLLLFLSGFLAGGGQKSTSGQV